VVVDDFRYGRVKLVEEVRCKKKFAMKMVPRARRRRNSFSARHLFEEDDTAHEIAILKKLDHRNVIKIEEIICASKASKFYVVMEYVHFEILRSCGRAYNAGVHVLLN